MRRLGRFACSGYYARTLASVVSYNGDGSYTMVITFSNEVAGGTSHIHAYNVAANGTRTTYTNPPATQLLTVGYPGSFIGTNISRYNGKFITMWTSRNRFVIVYRREADFTLTYIPFNTVVDSSISDGGGAVLSGDGTYIAMQRNKANVGSDGNGNPISNNDLLVYKYNGSSSYDLFFSLHLPTDQTITGITMSDDAKYIITAGGIYDAIGDIYATSQVYKMNAASTGWDAVSTLPGLDSWGNYTKLSTDATGKWLFAYDRNNAANVIWSRTGDVYTVHTGLTSIVTGNWTTDACFSCDGLTFAITDSTNSVVQAYSLSPTGATTVIPIEFTLGVDATNGSISLSGDGKFLMCKNFNVGTGFYYTRNETGFHKNVFEYTPNNTMDVVCSANNG